MKQTFRSVIVLSALWLLAGCGVSKSANPLSPTVAGPIAGVSITAPQPLDPAGTHVPTDKQPITLVAQNSTTNGVRPLTYLFEVAADAGFSTKITSRGGVAPGDGGKTSVRLTDMLQPGQTYYWRVRAEDGANSSSFATASFDVFTPVVIDPPVLISPANASTVTTTRPSLVASNSHRTGPAAPMNYEFMVGSDLAFSALLVDVGVSEQSGDRTQYNVAQDLPNSKTVFWRVRATDGSTISDWSSVGAFTTPAATPTPGPGPGPAPGPTGNCDSLVSDKLALVTCIHAGILPTDSASAFEVTKRVAWALRGEGAGLLIKNGGDNVVAWQGYSFSASRICYPDGHIYKVIGDAGPGGANSPGWSDNGFVDPSLYVKAIDPSLK